MGVLENLQPQKVLYFFEEISNIPRGSGNEKAIAEYCYNFGKERGLNSDLDKNLNVIIKKPGTAGKEKNNAVILQGHTDMVCEKNAGCTHDFMTEGIKLIVDGDNIRADGTTLGGDNGIAVAAMLAILDDNSLEHPPLECVFTSEEETGLKGAHSLDYSKLSGTYMINLDTEEYGECYVSCAGGMRADTELDINWIDSSLPDADTYAIRVRGLKGGHSGADIHLGRGNANKIIGRTLDYLQGKIDFEICSVSGGLQDNAIPREAQAYINIHASEESKLEELLSAFEAIIIDEFRIPEQGITINSAKEEKLTKAFCKETQAKVIAILLTTPNGVQAMSFDIPGLVETSNNLGIVAMKENSIVFSCATRSSVETRKDSIEHVMKAIAQLAGAKFTVRNKYPGWKYEPNSVLRDKAIEVFKQTDGQELKIKAIHAGLECGIFKSNLPNVDIISIGPDMWDVHTPEERVSIASIEKLNNFLTALLKSL